MNAATAIYTPRACRIGNVAVTVHGMRIPDAMLGLHFETQACGLSAGFIGTTAELRAFAELVLQHCDATDAAEQVSA